MCDIPISEQPVYENDPCETAAMLDRMASENPAELYFMVDDRRCREPATIVCKDDGSGRDPFDLLREQWADVYDILPDVLLVSAPDGSIIRNLYAYYCYAGRQVSFFERIGMKRNDPAKEVRYVIAGTTCTALWDYGPRDTWRMMTFELKPYQKGMMLLDGADPEYEYWKNEEGQYVAYVNARCFR